MDSAYNQMSSDEQSRRLTQFVIGNQQNEFNRLFYRFSKKRAVFFNLYEQNIMATHS